MEKVFSDKYLGDILSSNGTNCINLKERIGKGIGKINEILSILDTISFGHQYFRILILLREAMFINSILTNTDIWYGVKESEVTELEDLDRSLLRRAFQCPMTTPKEACHLELGLLPISCILKSRRANYFHYLVNSEQDGMLFKFFQAMRENPSKDDWTEQAAKDLKDLEIEENVSFFKSISKVKFEKIVKLKTKEHALDRLNEEKFKHSKMENLVFTSLEIQNYLSSEEITLAQKRNIFLFRTRMADYGENYGGGSSQLTIPCKICLLHSDCQAHSVTCHETLKGVTKKGNYKEIFTNKISTDTAIMLHEITEARKNKLG